MIRTDIKQSSEFSGKISQDTDVDKKRNCLQESYCDMLYSVKNIKDLKLTQYFLDRAIYVIDPDEDAERLYSMAIQNDWEEEYRSRCKDLLKRI